MKAGSPFYVLKKKKQCFQLFPNRKRTLVLHDRFFFASERVHKSNCVPEKSCALKLNLCRPATII